MPEYRFDEIAFNSTEKKKPAEEDKYTYIGLEHLDSGSLEVTRWGSDIAPIGEKLIMKKGDILFGKRRAYQKKVGIAPFDGIFSAHGMVLRPRKNVITEEFFPLFISSDYFLDEAIRISVGSLSPTINWKDLKELCFTIPTIERQREIAPVIWAAINTKKAYKQLLEKTDDLVKSQFIEMFGDPESALESNHKISDVADVQVGIVIKPTRYYADGADGIKAFRSLNIGSMCIKDDDWIYFTKEAMKETQRTIAHTGDVLIVRSGSPGTSCVVTPEYDGCNVVDLIIAHPKTDKVLPEYLCAFTNFPHGKNQIDSQQRGIAQKHFNVGMYNELKLILPPLEKQKRFVQFLEQSDKSKFVFSFTEKNFKIQNIIDGIRNL